MNNELYTQNFGRTKILERCAKSTFLLSETEIKKKDKEEILNFKEER